jgi:chitinase
LRQGYTMYRDSITQEPWLWDGNSSFVTYDDPTSLEFKAQYVAKQGLGGIMIWELSGDTPQRKSHSGVDRQPGR